MKGDILQDVIQNGKLKTYDLENKIKSKVKIQNTNQYSLILPK